MSDVALVVVEDMHAADADSAQVVAFLSSRLTTSPVLVVATFRPDDLRAAAAEALESVSTACRTVVVPPLDTTSARELAAELLGEQAADGVVERVVARSDGNAFYLRELAHGARRRHPSGRRGRRRTTPARAAAGADHRAARAVRVRRPDVRRSRGRRGRWD